MTEETDSAEITPRASQPNFLTKTRFDDFDLDHAILAGLAEVGFEYCTPIQAQVLPVSLTGKDIAGQAQTGTGKTAAFLVTVFARLLAREKKESPEPAALIVAPTRELALQVYEDAVLLGKYTGLTMALAIGGIDYHEQADAIRRGPDIIIATPGRIIDYLKQGIFKTRQIEALVIDEADRLFDLGFIKDLRYLLKKLPPYDRRQSMLFSATLSYRVLELTYDYMNLPEFISVTPEEVTVEGIDQVLYHVGREEKLPLLLGILEKEDWVRVLIFVNTKAGVEWVAKKLQGNGLPAEAITGDLPQRKRLRLMERFKDGQIKILVATDVASRGIHVEDISHVINYDLPQDVENYVHRIGRTARAGKTGRAISLACEEYVFHLEALEELLGDHLPVAWIEDGLLGEDEAGEVRIERYSRSGRSSPRKERPGGSRERSDRSDSGRRRPPRKTPRITRPGGIFGLAPGWREALAESQSEVQAEAAEDPKKKKRRRRRKKKTTAEGETKPEGMAPESSPEEPPALEGEA